MCVLLFGVFKHLLWEKTDVLKLFGKENFSERKFEELYYKVY